MSDKNGLPDHRLSLGDLVLQQERESTQLPEVGSPGLGDMRKDHKIKLSDYPKALGMGAASIVEASGDVAGRAADYLKDKAGPVGPAYSALFRAPEALGKVAGSVSDGLESSLSDDAKEARGLPMFTDEGTISSVRLGDGAKELDVVALKLSEALGSLIPTAGVGGVAGRAVTNTMTKALLKKGYAPGQAEYIAGRALAEKAGRVAGASTATEIGTTAYMGGAARDVSEKLAEIPLEARLTSDSGRRNYEQVLQEEEWKGKSPLEQQTEALRRQEQELTGAAMFDPKTVALGAAGTLLGDVGLMRMVSGAGKATSIGAGKAGSAAQGFAMEGATEGVQGGAQTYMTNERLINEAGLEGDAMDGVISGALEEGVLGGAAGGAVGTYAGSRNNKARSAQAEQEANQQSEAEIETSQAEVDPNVEGEPTEIEVTKSVDDTNRPQVVPSDDPRVGRAFAFPPNSGDVYQIIENVDGKTYRVANASTGETLNVNAGNLSGQLDVDGLIAQYEQKSNETGDATLAESDQAGQSPVEFDVRAEVPAYLRQDTDLDGREVRPTWDDNEAQQALSRGESAPTAEDLIQQQQEQGPISEAEPEQMTGDIETWQPNWREGRQERSQRQQPKPEPEYIPLQADASAGQETVINSDRRLESPTIDTQGVEIDESRGLSYNRTINMGGEAGSTQGNPNYVPPLTERQDRSVEPQSMRDSRIGVGKALKDAGKESDQIWQELSTLRVTKRGKPFTNEKEAQMASRKDEQPVKLPEGYGIAKQSEVAETQAEQSSTTVEQMEPSIQSESVIPSDEAARPTNKTEEISLIENSAKDDVSLIQQEPKLLYKVNGSPFATEKTAKISRAYRDNPNAEIVPVNGGFAVRPPQEALADNKKTPQELDINTPLSQPGASPEPALTYKVDGHPFATEKSARMSKAFKGTPSAAVEQVGGGFAIRPARSEDPKLTKQKDTNQVTEAELTERDRSVSAQGVTVSVPSIPQGIVDSYNRATHMGKGRDINAELKSEAESILDDLSTRAHTLDTDKQKAKASELITEYLHSKADFNKWDASQAGRNPSWAITGRGGRNMDKVNSANERHMDKFTERVNHLEQKKKSISDQLYRMRPESVKKKQAQSRAQREVVSLSQLLADYMREGKPALAADARKWASPKIAKFLESALGGNRDSTLKLVKEVDGKLENVGGLTKVVGPRSKAGKLVAELLSESDSKPAEGDLGSQQDTTRLSKGRSAKRSFTPINKVELDSILNRVAPGLKDSDRVVVVDSASDLFSLSPEIEKEARKQGSDGSDIDGVFHGDKIYLVRDMIRDQLHAETVLFHEATHAGFAAMMKDEGVLKASSRLFMALGGTHGLNKAIERMGLQEQIQPYINGVTESNKDGSVKYTSDQRNAILVGELVAFTGEQVSKSVRQRARELVGAIRQWLRNKGFLRLSEVSTAEIAHLAQKARAIGLGGIQSGDVATPLFSRSADSSTTESALDKLNLGPKPDIIDKAKASLNTLRDVDRKGAAKWITRVGRKANTEMLDALSPIKYIEEMLDIQDAKDSGYVASRLATGSSSTMLGAMLHGLPEWKDGVIQRKEGSTDKDALVGIIQPLGKDLHSWLGWMAGHRAEILMEQGRENLLTANEIQSLKALGKGKEKQFNEAKKKWNDFNGAILDLAQEAGLVSAEARAGFESEWYIPFFRETEDGDALAPFNSKGVANQRSGIRKLKGGTDKTSDLLENMFHSTGKMIDAAMKNHAARKTVENLMDTGFIEVIENPNLMDMRAKDQKKEVFTIRHNGEEVYVRTLDDGLFKAMTMLDRKPFDDPFTKVGMMAKRLLTATVTSSPEFMLRNFLRDGLSAWVVSKDKYNPLDAIHGVVSAYKMDGGAMDMMFAGSSFVGGYVNANDPQGMADTIRKGLRRKGMSPEQIVKYEKSIIRNASQAKGVIADAWAKYNRYGEAGENATREAVYAAAIKQGKSKAQAAFEAKDQMDFSMLGASRTLQWFTSVLPFFNARIQGLGKLGREFKDNPKGVATKGSAIMAGSLALLAANWDNEDYEALPDWDKDMNWHFWLGDQHFRIPKPFEVGVIFGTIPERAVRAMGDKDTGAEFGKAVARSMAETFSLNPIPQAVNPMVELYTNHDFFKGRSIETQYDKALRPEARYDERTSQTMREIGELTGMSPKQLDHLVRGYLGTMGSYAMMITDSLINLGKDEGAKPASKSWEWPVIKAVYQGDGSSPAKSTKQIGQLYEMLDKVTELHNTVNAYRKENRIEDANRLANKEGDMLRSRSSLTRAQRQMRQLRNQMDLIKRDRTLTAKDKRERIDRILIRRNDIAARAVKDNEQWFE